MVFELGAVPVPSSRRGNEGTDGHRVDGNRRERPGNRGTIVRVTELTEGTDEGTGVCDEAFGDEVFEARDEPFALARRGVVELGAAEPFGV